MNEKFTDPECDIKVCDTINCLLGLSRLAPNIGDSSGGAESLSSLLSTLLSSNILGPATSVTGDLVAL
jgi:hypothetical protein